jgi:hypothetical protein
MSYDGLPARAGGGCVARPAAREAAADRRTGLLAAAGLSLSLILVACGGSSSSGGVAGASGTPEATSATSASPSTEASASASAGLNKGFLVFQEQNASKVFGGGTLIDLGDGTVAISLGVVAMGFDEPMPARLVSGACTDAASAPAPSFAVPSAAASAGASTAASAAPSLEPSAEASAGASVAPTPATLPVDLTPVNGGSSSTVVQIALSDLLASPSSVLLYKSAAEPTLVACADVAAQLLVPSAAPGASGGTESAAPSLPAASESTAP